MMTSTLARRTAVLTLIGALLAPVPTQAQQAVLALPDSAQLSCEPVDPGLGARLAARGAVGRQFILGDGEGESSTRQLTVGRDSAGALVIFTDVVIGREGGDIVWATSAPDGKLAGRRQSTKVDAMRAQAAADAGNAKGVRDAMTPVAARDIDDVERDAIARLADWLWKQPCTRTSR
jgi:hypothetical protein